MVFIKIFLIFVGYLVVNLLIVEKVVVNGVIFIIYFFNVMLLVSEGRFKIKIL